MTQGEGKTAAQGLVILEPGSFGMRRRALIRIFTADPDSSGSSVTLVRTLTTSVVIDSGGGKDREDIIKGFKDNQLAAEKINVLLTTCAACGYAENDDLFPHALQHVSRRDWSSVKGATSRRVMIATDVHWIDRYLKIIRLKVEGSEVLTLQVHFPAKEELMEPASREFCGKVVGVLGAAMPSARMVAGLIDEVRRERAAGAKLETVPKTIKDMLMSCDVVVPGRGDMIHL